MIKAVFIDADNTLLDFDKCSYFAMKSAFDKENLNFKNEYFEIFLTVNNSLWDRYEKREITKEGIFGIRWVNLFKVLGIDFDGFEFEKLFRSYLDISCEKVCGAEEILGYLSSKYEVFIISNAAEKQQKTRLELAGLSKYVKEIYTSERIGYQKPDAEYFEACYNLSGHTPLDTVIIGDSLTADIQGGKKTGAKTVWFDFHKTNNTKGENPDYTVDNLSDIKNIL